MPRPGRPVIATCTKTGKTVRHGSVSATAKAVGVGRASIFYALNPKVRGWTFRYEDGMPTDPYVRKAAKARKVKA